jgi:hypothetical protein
MVYAPVIKIAQVKDKEKRGVCQLDIFDEMRFTEKLRTLMACLNDVGDNVSIVD